MPAKFATVRVPLRTAHHSRGPAYYQERGQGEAANRSQRIRDIATNDGTVRALDASEIDRLCERLNTTV